MIVGIDVGGTKVLALAVDAGSGEVLAEERAATVTDAHRIVALVHRLVDDLARQVGHAARVVGVGVAGFVTHDGVVRCSPHLPGLVDFPLAGPLNAALAAPVVVVNDADSACWAEHRLGAATGHDDVVFVGLGTGIGAGLIVGGRMVRGANGFAGEAGHMIVDPAGPVHLTGARGPWEQAASGSGLGVIAGEAYRAGRFALGSDLADSSGRISADKLLGPVRAGDPQALAILDEYAGRVGTGLANVVQLLDPGLVVLGGGVSDLGEPLRARIEREMLDQLRPRAQRSTPVVIAALGARAGAVGAALLAKDLRDAS